VTALLQASSLLLGVPGVLLLLAATAFVLGRLLTGDLEQAVERWAVPTALGLAVLAHLGLLLGFAHLLRPLPVLILAAAIHGLGIPLWRRFPAAAGRALRRAGGWGVALGAVAAAPFCVLPFYPPTAFDATLYHLPFARGFVESGGVPFLKDLRFPVFPQANEMLFALAMLFAPDVAAHGVQLLMTILTAALVWAWGRDAFSGTAAGWLAAAVFLGNPIVAYLAGNAYLEAGLTLFITAALYAARRWRGTGERRWLVIAAVFAATAADTKYLGLFVLGVIGLTVVLGHLPARTSRARWAGVLLFSAVAVLALAPWYLRIYLWTGNPLFPFFPQTFGAGAWAPIRFHSFLAPTHRPDGTRIGREGFLGSRLVDLVRLPYDLVFERAKYNGQPPISPFYLGALPLALLAAWRDRRQWRQWRLLGFPAAYAFACLALPADARYLVPTLPLLSLAAAGGLMPWLGRFRPGWTAGLCAALFLPGWLYAGFAIHRQGPLPLRAERREAYLARWQPCYPAVSYLNRTLGSGYAVWALHAENMAFYARGRFMGDWIGLARFDRVLPGLRDPGELHDRLRRLGAGYLLLPSQTKGEAMNLPFPRDAAFQRWFEPIYTDPRASVYRLR
jgi:4-amino-4-deoxy-L-arabinose transferase-like glycosyltransferase